MQRNQNNLFLIRWELIPILTSLDFLKINSIWPPSDTDEVKRLQEHITNRRLYEELHELVFPKYAKYLADKSFDDKIQKIIIGIAETAVSAYMDLLLGEAPDIEAPKIYDLPAEEIYIDCARYGWGILEVSESGIGSVNPENVYLVINPSDIRDVTAYVIFSEFQIPAVEPGKPSKQYVKFTIHQPGTIQHLVYLVKDSKLEQRIPLTEFPEYANLEVDADGIQQTGIDEMLIVRADNALSSDRYYGRSDYSPSVHTLIEALDMAFARRAEVLAKFSRPVPMVPENAMKFDHSTQRWIFKTSDAIILKEGQPTAGYLTWAASLADVEVEIQDLISQLLIKLKISRVLLAGENAGQAESGTALKIRLIPTLAKVRKFATSYKKVLPLAFSLMSKLEVALGIPNEGAFEPDDVKIEMKDGIPDIPLEVAQLRLVNAQTVATLKTAGVLDNKAAMRAALSLGILTHEMLLASDDPEIEAAVAQVSADSIDQGGM